jgi:hypothetical protein
MRSQRPPGAACPDRADRTGGGVGKLDRHMAARDRAVAGIETLATGATIGVGCRIVAETLLGKAAVGDRAATLGSGDIRSNSVRLARLDVLALVIAHVRHGSDALDAKSILGRPDSGRQRSAGQRGRVELKRDDRDGNRHHIGISDAIGRRTTQGCENDRSRRPARAEARVRPVAYDAEGTKRPRWSACGRGGCRSSFLPQRDPEAVRKHLSAM